MDNIATGMLGWQMNSQGGGFLPETPSKENAGDEVVAISICPRIIRRMEGWTNRWQTPMTPRVAGEGGSSVGGKRMDASHDLANSSFKEKQAGKVTAFKAP
jgi:hypothetical protein